MKAVRSRSAPASPVKIIPPDAIPKVFDAHYPSVGSIPGIGDDGVGLSIVRSLTEAMGGRIWVENDPEGGAKFTLLLPLAEQPVAGSSSTDA
jgi:signal transduction histidine kinase